MPNDHLFTPHAPSTPVHHRVSVESDGDDVDIKIDGHLVAFFSYDAYVKRYKLHLGYLGPGTAAALGLELQKDHITVVW